MSLYEQSRKNILTLNHEEAMDFFMKSDQYHGFELPEYFTFDEVLRYVREKVGSTPYVEDLLNKQKIESNRIELKKKH